MNGAGQEQVLMVGLPESGKSTYLGAIYYLLRTGSDPRLQLLEPPEERDYLQELENNWLRFKSFERSQHPAPKRVELKLGGPAEERVELSMPDVTGESYNQLWEDGTWRAPVLDVARAASGLLLFVRADTVKSPELIDVANPVLADGRLSDWHPRIAPTQSKLCDLLESVIAERAEPILKVAVLVSAWDEAADLEISPERWLELQTPLLWQWLTAQEHPFSFEVFGVSAQGGNLDDSNVKERLAAHGDPKTRLLDGPGADGPLDPLLWLLRT
jgi:hypothetical protein